MANATEKERATQSRATGDAGKKRPYVMLVPGTRGGFEGVIVQPPDEITFEDETPITPSQKFREQGVRQQAESVLSQAAKGQHYKDDYLDKLQQQLRRSGDRSSQDLTGAVGRLRASQRVRDEARLTAPSNRGVEARVEPAPSPPPSAGGAPALPPSQPEKRPEEPFPSSDLNAILAGIGLVRRQAEARGLTNRFASGEQVSAREARRAAQRLAAAGKQAETVGLETGDFGQLISLGEIQFSQLQKAIEDVEGGEQKGRRAGGKQLTYLGQTALGAERQYQLLGLEGAGRGLDAAEQLAEIKRAHIENDIKDVLDKAKRKEWSGSAYIDYLQQNLLAAERQDQLLGKGSPASTLELASALGALRRVPLSEEARDVIDALGRGQDLDDEYVEFLRRRLVEDAERRRNSQTRELAGQLRDRQAARLEAQVQKILDDAKSGKRFPEFYLTYLQQRIGETEADDTNPDRKSRWKKLARALDDLIG